MDSPATSQITWRTTVVLTLFCMLQWVISYAVGCALCGNPPDAAALLCSVWAIFPGAFLPYIFREARTYNLCAVAVCLAIGFVALGVGGGYVAATKPVRNWDLRQPRTVQETAADVVMGATFGSQAGMAGGATIGLLVGYLTRRRPASAQCIERLW